MSEQKDILENRIETLNEVAAFYAGELSGCLDKYDDLIRRLREAVEEVKIHKNFHPYPSICSALDIIYRHIPELEEVEK